MKVIFLLVLNSVWKLKKRSVFNRNKILLFGLFEKIIFPAKGPTKSSQSLQLQGMLYRYAPSFARKYKAREEATDNGNHSCIANLKRFIVKDLTRSVDLVAENEDRAVGQLFVR